MTIKKTFLTIIFILLSNTVLATEEIYIDHPEFSKRFKILKIGKYKEKLLPGKIYEIGAKVFYKFIDYSGIVMKTYFIFEKEHALFINAKYKYFIGQDTFLITDKIKLPFEVWELKPVKVICHLYVTRSYRKDDDDFICSLEYEVENNE